jgi:hypothetical protein
MEGHAMASIHKEVLVEASLEEVWSAIRDVGDIHTRLVWIADLLPDDLADLVNGMMDQGCAAMRRTLETHNGHNEGIN